jgi:hypothetical protein
MPTRRKDKEKLLGKSKNIKITEFNTDKLTLDPWSFQTGT